ncbi:hypothetical protein FOVSG1_007879 [Fusarium oxysporum f. sp. vasinfectum]
MMGPHALWNIKQTPAASVSASAVAAMLPTEQLIFDLSFFDSPHTPSRPEHLILNRPAAKPNPEPVPLDLSPHSRLISFSPKITCQSTSRHYPRHLSQTRSCAADRPTCSLQSRYPIPPVVSGGARNCTSLPLELISSIQPTCSPSVVALSFEFPASASENSFLFIVVACQLAKNNNPSPYVPTLFLSKVRCSPIVRPNIITSCFSSLLSHPA